MRSAKNSLNIELLFYDFPGKFLRLDPVRRMVAEELYFDSLRPFVETPDLLQYEHKWLEDWKRLRPEIYRKSQDSAGRTLQPFNLSERASSEDRDRLLLRLAALRRLDSWLAKTGDKMVERPSSLGGELYWPTLVPGFECSMKVGYNLMPDSYPDPSGAAALMAVLENEATISAVEFSLFPLAGRKGLNRPDHWRKIRARWRETAVLRDFDAASEFSVFPSGYLFTKRPTGMVERVPQEFLSQINPLLFHELGLCPWLPVVTAAFLESHRHEFDPRASDDQIRIWLARVFFPVNENCA